MERINSYDVIDLKLHSRRHGPPGYVVAYEMPDLEDMFYYAEGRLPRWQIEKLCKFDKGNVAIVAFTLPVPNDYELVALDCYEADTTKRFKFNLGYVAGDKPDDKYSQRLIVMTSALPPPPDFDLFLHHDNAATACNVFAPEDIFVQLRPLQRYLPIGRVESPIKKLSEQPKIF